MSLGLSDANVTLAAVLSLRKVAVHIPVQRLPGLPETIDVLVPVPPAKEGPVPPAKNRARAPSKARSHPKREDDAGGWWVLVAP